ncbi:hypothetical protein HID58_056938, partial [Brassica napus]
MPLLAPSVPPGFAPKSIVAPEVFEQMQLYMNCTDPEERRIREFKMKMALQDLSMNPGAQSSYLRLEDPPMISGVQNKNIGRGASLTSEWLKQCKRTLKQKTTLTGESLQKELTVAKRSRQTELLEMPFKTLEGSGEYLPPKLGALFSIGHDEHSVSGKSDRSKSSKRKVASWRRFKQEPKGALTDAGIESPRATQDEGDSNSNNPEVLELVRKGWNVDQNRQVATVSERIASCRKILAQWKRTGASNSKKMIMKLRTELEEEEKKLFTSSRTSDATELLRDLVPRVTERMNENLTK